MPSSLCAALDRKSRTPTMNIGEKGHQQYSWITPNSNTQEAFVQLYFQMVRAKTVEESKFFYTKILEILTECHPYDTEERREVARYLYILIGHTRDIIKGKGERTLAYAGIFAWYSINAKQAKFLLRSFVHDIDQDGNNGTGHQYGSWNDIKYFCDYVSQMTNDRNHELISYAIQLMSEQIKIDFHNFSESKPVSLAIRHMPKQGKRNGWLYTQIAKYIYPFHETATTHDSRRSAVRKAEMTLRKQYTEINRRVLKTPQVFMASGQKGEGEWDKLEFGSMTSKTLRAYPKAFYNQTKQGEQRSMELHRLRCAETYRLHMASVAKGEAKVNGKRCNPYELVKDVLEHGWSSSSPEDARINGQWADKMTTALPVSNFIPIADVSGSMTCDNGTPLYSAIGLSIRLSETSVFKDRVMTFHDSPSWVKFHRTDTFCKKVRTVRNAKWGMTTDLYKAMQLIVDTILENDIPPKEVENLVLAIFSDMSIDQGTVGGHGAVSSRIRTMFSDAGMRSRYRQPFQAPHILWWNLRTTSGFPEVSSQKNTTMLSGYSDSLMNAFYEKGMDALKDYTPRKMIYDILDDERYTPLKNEFNK